MLGQNKGFLNQNRFKSSKVIKRLAKCRAGVDSRNKVMDKSGRDKKTNYGGR